MKKVDFSKIIVRGIDGQPYMVKESDKKVPYDFSKVLGNAMFYTGKDLRISELGQKIYHHEEVELSDEEVKEVREFINNGFVPFILLSVNPQLDKMLKK